MKPTILISDDEPQIIEALARHATLLGCQVIIDTKGDALALAKQTLPTVIVLDVYQSGVDGRDTLTRLKQDDVVGRTEVIVVSGSREPRLRADCLALGATAFVHKPLTMQFMKSVAELATAVVKGQASPKWAASLFDDEASGSEK